MSFVGLRSRVTGPLIDSREGKNNCHTYLELAHVLPAALPHPAHRMLRVAPERQIAALVHDILLEDDTERPRHVDHCNEWKALAKNALSGQLRHTHTHTGRRNH